MSGPKLIVNYNGKKIFSYFGKCDKRNFGRYEINSSISIGEEEESDSPINYENEYGTLIHNKKEYDLDLEKCKAYMVDGCEVMDLF